VVRGERRAEKEEEGVVEGSELREGKQNVG
jgi:hypothetical protein